MVENIKADEGAIYRAKEFREALPKTVKNIDAGPTRTFSVKAEDVVPQNLFRKSIANTMTGTISSATL